MLCATVLVAPGLSACRPMYGPTASGVPLKEVMAAVEINTIPGRVGQRVRNELIFATTRGGDANKPEYRLDIAVRESASSLLVTQTGDAQAEMFHLDADFKLVKIATNEVVFQGKSSGRAAFDRYESIFTNVRGRRDAEDRAASTIADDIRTRIAAYLSSTA
jgi:LPS-assembly lipoprotein